MGTTKLLGLEISIDEEAEGKITKETADAIYIESDFFTGWMAKTEFWDSWGLPDDSDFNIVPA